MTGWNLPPGCNVSDIPGCGEYEFCDLCAHDLDHCICPECPICGEIGNPRCYDDLACEAGSAPVGFPHGLKRTQAQLDSVAEFDRKQADALRIEAELHAREKGRDDT